MFQVKVFWVVMLHSVVVEYHFIRPCSLHLQGDGGSMVIWTVGIL